MLLNHSNRNDHSSICSNSGNHVRSESLKNKGDFSESHQRIDVDLKMTFLKKKFEHSLCYWLTAICVLLLLFGSAVFIFFTKISGNKMPLRYILILVQYDIKRTTKCRPIIMVHYCFMLGNNFDSKETCPLPDIPNGVWESRIVSTPHRRIHLAIYHCDEGYDEGDLEVRRCSSGKIFDYSNSQPVPPNQWSGEKPLCIRKSKLFKSCYDFIES